MNSNLEHLLEAIRRPECLRQLGETEWDSLLRHARAAGLLSRMALDLRESSGWSDVPETVRRQMSAALAVADRQIRAVRWEVHQIHRALGHLDIPLVLLKGAAYVMAELTPARGRLFGDIDLLVPREELTRVEQQLGYHGWFGAHHDPYDQRYYREWMHEIPPLTHITRGSTIDVHHNILPLTSRLKPRAADLFSDLVPIAGYRNLFRLGNADMVLHGAAHLFHEGEWAHGLRDLADLDALLRDFGELPGFWEALRDRARTLNLSLPLRYALRCAHELFATPVEFPASMKHLPLTEVSMIGLFRHGFAASHRDLDNPLGRSALFILYLRSHWLRMPLRLLIPHLLRKSFPSNRPSV